MIISPGRKFIFVHIPKTGGTSLALALEDRAKKDDILIGDTPKAQQRKGRLDSVQTAGRLWKHSTLSDVRGLITQHDIETFFVLTLVRNPWDRIVSLYHWLQDQSFGHPLAELAKASDFSTFLNAPLLQVSIASQGYGSYVADEAGQEQATLYARIEAADTDLKPFWDHLGFRLHLPHVNRSARAQDYRHYYTDADAGLVAQLCGRDIARSGYSFDPPG